jgi:hypothetical protein
VSEPQRDTEVLLEAETSSKKRKAPEKPTPFTRTPPVKPVSTRRSVIAKLPGGLNSKIEGVVKPHAKRTVDNFKKMNSVSPTARTTKQASKQKEKTRQFVLELSDQLEKTKKQRVAAKKLTGPKLTTKSKLIAKGKGESVSDAFLEYTGDDGDREFAFPFGNRMGKASTDKDEVGVLNPGYKIGIQPMQMLGHLSQVFMNAVNDYEYESMLVNDRVFVASNAEETINQFRKKTLQSFLADAAQKVVADAEAQSSKQRAYRIGALSEALKLDPMSTDDLTPQQKDGAALLAEYEVGHYIDHAVRKDIASFLGLLQHQAQNAIKMRKPKTPEDAAGQITGSPQYSVNLVKPPQQGGWHAEQALVMTLVLGGWTGGAVVSGTKQPCFCCWLTLSLLPQCGYPLTYNLAPGFTWDTTTMAGLTKVAKALGIAKVSVLLDMFEATQVLTGDQYKQFMTALTTQTDLTVDVTIGGERLRARGLTQDQSSKSFIFPRDEEELTGGEFPDEPPDSQYGDFGSPPSSPSITQEKMEIDDYEKEQSEFDAAKKKADEEEERYQKALKEFEEDD